MKLRTLDISGFGRLRDKSIEFHPQLTLITGANESGKSTVQRAIRAALYGLDAGGPGRPIERSAWHRWQPWAPGKYGLALLYMLDDGSEFRVAMRLDRRRQSVEVRQIGRGDVTAQMRHGRIVAPGLVQLGIDESVFRATACLDDDSLSLSARDTPTQHAQRLHEAIERLSDAAGDTTTREAFARLEEARSRIGNERRTTSPLGRCLQRIRQLETLVGDAQRKSEAILNEQETLQRLEEQSQAAALRESEAEKLWLSGRIAAIDGELQEIETLTGWLRSATDESEEFAAVPLHEEERILSLGAELHGAEKSEEAAAEAWADVAGEVSAIDTRCQEIEKGMAILETSSLTESASPQRVADLRAELRATHMALRELFDPANDARIEGLRAEIAKSAVPLLTRNQVDEISAAATDALARSTLSFGLSLVALLSAAVAGAAALAHQRWFALLAVSLAVVSVAASAICGRTHRRSAAQAKARLRDIDKSIVRNRGTLRAFAARLPRVAALHDELAGEENASDDRFRRHAQTEDRLLELRGEAMQMARQLRVVVPEADDPATAALAAIDAAFENAQRQRELRAELESLRLRRNDLQRLRLALDSATHKRNEREQVLRQHLVRAGISAQLPVPLAIAAFRDACRRRREAESIHQEIRAAHARLKRLGDAAVLEKLRAELVSQLAKRGKTVQDDAAPLDAAALGALESQVEYARREHASASAQSRELRGRLTALVENAPPLADLHDELTHLYESRDRALRRLRALDLAQEMIQGTTKSVHESLAPRLAQSLTERISWLTDGRYRSVDIDSENFEVSLLGTDRPEYIPLSLVSHGTRDQVSLLLRLALAESLGSGESLPVILDEPLITSDDSRHQRALEFLVELSKQQQIILTSCNASTVVALQRLTSDMTAVELGTNPVMTVLSGETAAAG